MNRFLIIVVFLLISCGNLFAQFTFKGKIINVSTKKPVENVNISLNDNTYWAISNKNGDFSIINIPTGSYKITIRSIGFVPIEEERTINKNLSNIVFHIEENTLSLDNVEINAQRTKNPATSYILDKKALDHLQMLNVTDAMALLPGGKTSTTNNLASSSAQVFSVNGRSGEAGNPLFGVGLEVDGARLSNNAARDLGGINTKNIGINNIESIEVITGVPSVEYGDITNGIVKINTKKGQTPYTLDLNTSPNNKSVALSKGYNLGKNAGILNWSAEHLKSISNLASPYTDYKRNELSLNYSNTFNKNGKPIQISIGVAGNIGGYNSENDPDKFVNTYTKYKDNAIRGNYNFKWLLNKSWITNIENSGSIVFNDKLQESSSNKSYSSSTAALHTLNEGYFIGETYASNPNANIILIPKGYWYEIEYTDSKLLTINNKLKANWFKKINTAENKLIAGLDFSRSGNLGQGNYFDDYQYAPTWRPYQYKNESYMNNYALFVEDNLNIPIANKNLEITAGLRNEITSIKGSEYGNVNSFSPRGNIKYTFIDDKYAFVKHLDVKIGLGKTVKLPSFNVLYSVPNYTDIQTFSPGTTSTGETFYAYYSQPISREFNSDLKWQHNIQKEISVNLNLAGHRLFINVSNNKTFNPYTSINVYTPFTYKYTSQADLEKSNIAIANRIYHVNQQTGIVSVKDATGVYPTETLSYKEISTFNSRVKYTNGSPATRTGISFMANFKPIKSLKTDIQLDGNYYQYKNLNEQMLVYRPNATLQMADGSPYKYLGYFIGGSSLSNGEINKSINLNLTVTTRIPKVKLIVSARVEGSLYTYSKNISEVNGAQRGFIIDKAEDFFPSANQSSIYTANKLVAIYPEYFVSMDDMNTKVAFAELFKWAYSNNLSLYNDLSKLVIKTSYNGYYNENKISSYFSANIGLTKEIGKIISVSFNAKNFFNNMATISSSQYGTESSLFNSGGIPKLYYSLSLRLKI
jgi:hypothetical protein